MIELISEKFVDKKSKKFPEGYYLWEINVSDEFLDLVKRVMKLKKNPTNLQIEKFIISSLEKAFDKMEEEEKLKNKTKKCCGKCKCGKK